MLRRFVLLFLSMQIAFVVLPASAAPIRVEDSGDTRIVPAGRWVTVLPPLGLVSKPIRVYLTDLELEVVAGVNRMINDIEVTPTAPLLKSGVTWYIEGAVTKSPTLKLQRKILYALNRAVDGLANVVGGWPFVIVMARSQKFIRETLEKLNCRPNLDRFNGMILMGAAVCDRRIVVSNITGYLYLVRSDQVLTAQLEQKPEKLISATPYRIVMRNSSALAHEFIHIWRAAGLSGQVRSDEPAWFSEGFAEFWAGVGKVLAYPDRVNYLTHHAVRVRDFSDWAISCTEPLSSYRRLSAYNNGCEYHVGLIAVEYLYSKYSSLAKTLFAFETGEGYASFQEGFFALFGITLDQFEQEAQNYIENLRQAERFG